jgi:hypothetical protein
MESEPTSVSIDPNLLNQTLLALQEQIMQMQMRHNEVFKVLNDHGMMKSPTLEDTPEVPHPATESEPRAVSTHPKNTGPKPVTPNDFDGDRTKGRSFLNSVKWYIRSRGTEFRDLDHMVSWTLSFMKEGRALTFANQVTRQVDKQGSLPYVTWKDFWAELERRFLPVVRATHPCSCLVIHRLREPH